MRYILLILALLVAACAPVAQPEAAPEAAPEPAPTTAPDVDVEETVVGGEPLNITEMIEEPEEEPEEEVVEEPVEEVRDPELKALIDRALEKDYDNFRFVYSGPEFPQSSVDYYIKGSKGKAVVSTPITFRVNETYDTVYLDFNVGSAVGYCEDIECTNKDMAIDVDFQDYLVLNPVERLKRIKNPERTGREQFDRRATITVTYTSAAGESMRAAIDEFYGLPLKVEKLDSEGNVVQKIEYRGFGLMRVKDSDVTPP